MNRWIALLVVVAVRAGAVTFSGHAGMVIDLSQRSASTAGLGDVVVMERTIEAQHGLRRLQAPIDFAQIAPLVVGDEYDVRDALGRHFRLWIRAVTASVTGPMFVVEVLAHSETPEVARRSELAGRYHLDSYTIDGLRAQARMPDLRLESAGVYRLGSASGDYAADDRRLFLDGYYKDWGPAEVSHGGAELTFRFMRGGATFELRYVRMEEAPTAVANARGSSAGAGAP